MPQPKSFTATGSRGIPEVSHDDLFAFHEAHFSQVALASFGNDFIDAPSQDEVQYDAAGESWEEDDGLGYYPDGVKRTLTDEQIEIFRHSELEALRKEKEREKQLNAKTDARMGERIDFGNDSSALSQAEGAPSALPASFQSNKKRKRKKRSKRPEPKPDLRKRTWDVVDKGLDSLEYD